MTFIKIQLKVNEVSSGQRLILHPSFLEIHSFCVILLTNQQTNQPTSHPSNQPINQPTSQPTNQTTNQLINQPPYQPSNQPTNQLTNQQTDQPTYKLTNQPTYEQTIKGENVKSKFLDLPLDCQMLTYVFRQKVTGVYSGPRFILHPTWKSVAFCVCAGVHMHLSYSVCTLFCIR